MGKIKKESTKTLFSVLIDNQNFEKVDKLAIRDKRSKAAIINQILAKCDI